MRDAKRIGWLLVLAVAWLRAAGLLAEEPRGAQAIASLRGALSGAIAGSGAPGASWGMQVVSAKTGAVWFETNSSRLFVPASNSKLFTVALALDRFGTGHVFRTRLRAVNRPDAAGRLAGDLWVEGGGDPAPGRGESSLTALAGFRDALRAVGVRSISGGIRLQSGWFEAAPYGPGWNWDDIPEGYGAAVGDFVFADNAARVVVEAGEAPGRPAKVRTEPLDGVFDVSMEIRTVGTNNPARVSLRRLPGSARLVVAGQIPVGSTHSERMSVPDPTLWFGRALREALAGGGIPVQGGVGTATPGSTAPIVLGEVQSAPLSELAALCLKPSNNLLAHQLWLQVGADARRRGVGDSNAAIGFDDSDRAAREMVAFAASMGIGARELTMEEGSGLSRKNLTTPAATVRLLRTMRARPSWPAFRAALPVGGVDGTLRARFTRPPLKGNVLAKTGTLRHVNALAGLLTTAGGQELVFAVYVNGFVPAERSRDGRSEIDRLVELLGQFEGRGPE